MDFRRISADELAKAAKLSLRAIREYLRTAPKDRTATDKTVKSLAGALSSKEVQCRPAYLAAWENSDGSIVTTDASDPTLKRPSSAQKPEAHEPAGPTKQKLTLRAETERELGLHDQTIEVAGRALPLVGCDWIERIEMEYEEYGGKQFALQGLIDDRRNIAAVAVPILDAEDGRGAAQFLIKRSATGVSSDGTEKSVPIYPTIFASKGEHGKELYRCLKEKVPVIVRAKLAIVKKRPATATEARFEGFFHFESGRPKPRPWAFVVEEVVSDAPRGKRR
jgi:hypothetical protein